MHNPFHAIRKADDLSQDHAARLFVPEASPIWENIQAPINHLIVGPRGAGKTMVLRQLHHQGTPSTSPYGYLSIYLQISRISDIFRSLFSPDQTDATGDEVRHYRLVFSDYLCLEVLRELAAVLSRNRKQITPNQLHRLLPLSANGVTTTSELEEWSSENQQKVEQSIHRWSIKEKCDWMPLFDLPATVERIPDILRASFPQLHPDSPCLYLLLDESSPIPEACQEVLNRLLHRGRSYCVKLAVRPYEWTTLRTNSGAKIEIDTDVKPLYIQYPDELSDEHVERMKTVVERTLAVEAGEPDLTVNAVFPNGSHRYAGFRSICAASSGNLQNLLTLCSCVVATAIEKGAKSATNISPETQHEAVVRYSKDYEERNPYDDSRLLCQALLRKVKLMSSSQQAIGFQYRHGPEDLILPDYIPESEGRLIKTAFSAGFVRNTDRQLVPLFDVPARFYLSRGLLPREGLALDTPIEPAISIDTEYIKNSTRPRVGRPRTPNERPLRAFLSTSFSNTLTQQREDLKGALRVVQVECRDVADETASQFLFSPIVTGIRNSDFTILDATIPRPYTMLEIGICAGIDQKSRNVICVVNDDGDDSNRCIERLPAFIAKLPIVRYSLDPERVQRAATEIRSRAFDLRAAPSEFSKVAITDVPLKPRRQRQTVFVSLPDRPRRKKTLERLKAALMEVGWTVIVEEDATSFSANELQVAVQCAYTSRVGVVDTTGVDGEPDLLQCFKLGLFVGKKAPWRALWVEEAGNADRRTFASVPNLGHRVWESEDSLCDAVLSFVQSGK